IEIVAGVSHQRGWTVNTRYGSDDIDSDRNLIGRRSIACEKRHGEGSIRGRCSENPAGSRINGKAWRQTEGSEIGWPVFGDDAIHEGFVHHSQHRLTIQDHRSTGARLSPS